MKQKIEIASLLGLLAIMVVVWNVYRTRPLASAGGFSFAESYTPMQVEDLGPHSKNLDATRKTEYTKTIRNIFSVYVPPPPPPPTPKVDPNAPPPTPQPPPSPTLPPNIKFFGYGTVPADGARRAFLSDGDEVYIVGEGETLLGRYRILKIGNANLEFEEVASGRRGTAMLEQPGPSA